ncbi:MAG: hypothetical protein IPO63_12290 [Bacteroidetes bacterium]|nr:hypothetical protein [Bacteroidota bacterium]
MIDSKFKYALGSYCRVTFIELNPFGYKFFNSSIEIGWNDILFFNGDSLISLCKETNTITVYYYNENKVPGNFYSDAEWGFSSVAKLFKGSEIRDVIFFKDCFILSYFNGIERWAFFEMDYWIDDECFLEFQTDMINYDKAQVSKFIFLTDLDFYNLRLLPDGIICLEKYSREKVDRLNFSNFEVESELYLNVPLGFNKIFDAQICGDFVFVLGIYPSMNSSNTEDEEYAFCVFSKGKLKNPKFLICKESTWIAEKEYFEWSSFKIFDKYILIHCTSRGIGIIEWEKLMNVEIEVNFENEFQSVKDGNRTNSECYQEINITDLIYINPWKRTIADMILINHRTCLIHFNSLEKGSTFVELSVKDIESFILDPNVKKTNLNYYDYQAELDFQSRNIDWSGEVYRTLTGELPPDDDQDFDYGDLRDGLGL